MVAVHSTVGMGSMGLTHAADPEAVLENRRRFASRMGRDPGSLSAIGAVHGTEVARIDAPTALVRGVDGLVTASPAVTLFATFADCYPLVLFDPRRPALALGHAGWRGTQGEIALRMLEALRREFGSRPDEIEAVIGPGICGACYEVGPEFKNNFDSGVLRPGRGDRLLLDLAEANRRQLAAAGVDEANLLILSTCTFESEELFSHRRTADGTRFAILAHLA